MLKKILIATLVATSFGSLPAISSAQQRAIVITQPPPPPREERIPAPRRGMVWAPGHWDWRHNRHVWVEGHWIRERRGHHWVADRWVEREGRWERHPGYWERGDRDHDGVPNRLDNHPNDPTRR